MIGIQVLFFLSTVLFSYLILYSLIGWKLIKSEDGCDVYRKFLSGGLGSQYACVKCMGIVNAPPKNVFDLFEDNTRYVLPFFISYTRK